MLDIDSQVPAYSGAKKHIALLLIPVISAVIGIGLSQTSLAASDQQNVIKNAAWFSNVQVSITADKVTITSDGLPNWMAEKYAKPNTGIVVPASTKDVTLDLASNLVSVQKLNYSLTTAPVKAANVTSTSLGPIGILVNGAVVFNPYEGDGKTVAVTGNVYLKDSKGVQWGFLDVCNGHPGMGGMYHYHGMPPCVTKVIDKTGGPSHILGIAFDGFLIYGNKDINGKLVSSTQLDACNGIISPTPEFPEGVYHYVLTEEKSNRSTINCLAGTPADTKPGSGQQGGGPGGGPGGPQQSGMGGMGGLGGMGGPQQGGPQQGGPQQGGPQQGGPQQGGPQQGGPPQGAVGNPPLYKEIKTIQLVCQKGGSKKTIIATACPSGYKKISSKKITIYVEATGKP